MITNKEAIAYFERHLDLYCVDGISREAEEMAIKALETLEEFERAQIITGGRLNGRTYAYKCGLEDGKRKALEQQKTGHWINIDETHSKCDRCWAVFEITSPNGEINYCPNCRAKMEVEE